MTLDHIVVSSLCTALCGVEARDMRTKPHRTGCLARAPFAARFTATVLLMGITAIITLAIGHGALIARAQADVAVANSAPLGPTLADAWLETLPQLAEPISWSHAYGLLTADQPHLEQERRYLIEELNTLLVSARVSGNTRYSQAIAAWQDTLRGLEGQPIRSPERLDLPKLGVDLRKAPLLSRVEHWGACTIPAWVEVWGLQGVTRVAWQPNMSLATLANAINPRAFTLIDDIHLITPQGKVLRRGIAAWNNQQTPLAPGSRIVIELPNQQGLVGALPFPGTTHELDIINQRLPGVLAAQLPGDQCTQWQAH